MQEKIHIDVMRSPLGRVRGLGAAKSGAEHWWVQRATAVALVPLTVWFVLSVMGLLGADHATVVHWIGRPWHAALLLALIAATFQHLQLGLQVVVEDYIHDTQLRGATVMGIKGLSLLLGLLAAVSVLKLTF
ncbi:MAG TPA: succinate dehydrogenase, hydrophobic membrane anchor protein [Acetobacteraceae bacterium]|nr:succinate dehydrogenase, hydrophobic membrane anchor protein [Acetobacteraceae bacterium]